MFIDDFYNGFFVNGFRLLSKAVEFFDGKVVDAIVNGISKSVVLAGRIVKPIENGHAQLYAFLTVMFVSAFMLWLYILGGNG